MNLLLALLGMAVFGSGVFIAADRLYFTSIVFGMPILAVSSYCFLAAGVLLIIVCVFGCMGALYEKRALLFGYCIVLCIVFMLSFSAASLSIVFRSWVQDQVRTYMRSTLQSHYGINLTNPWNAEVTRSWDAAQQRWYCCSVEDESWGVYRASLWYEIQPGVVESTKPYVPESCCKKSQYGQYLNPGKCQLFDRGPPSKQSRELNEGLYYRGCYEAGKEILYPVSAYLIVMGLILCLCVLAGIVMSLCLYRLV